MIKHKAGDAAYWKLHFRVICQKVLSLHILTDKVGNFIIFNVKSNHYHYERKNKVVISFYQKDFDGRLYEKI